MTTTLRTDLYELTMIQAARDAGLHRRHCVFEVFTRSLPEGRRYGAFTGVGRVVDALAEFRFDEADLSFLTSTGKFSPDLLEFAKNYRFTGSLSTYPEGEVFFPNSPVVRVEGAFEECVLLETLILSVLNHDSAISSVGSRMVAAAAGRPCIEMGSRRVHEEAAVAAARAAAIVGFDSTSNLEAGDRYGIPVVGTSAHAFTLLFDSEEEAFQAQVNTLGAQTSLLVDTFDIPDAIASAVAIAGPQLGGVRIDSGDLGRTAREVRAQLDSLGATGTKITATSDLDEYRVFALRDAPLDGYGIGTRLVTGGDHPAQGFVYKLVERENSRGEKEAVAKYSAKKATIAGAKQAFRVLDTHGAAVAELVLTDKDAAATPTGLGFEYRPLLTPLIKDGTVKDTHDQWERIIRARRVHAAAVGELAKADPHILTGQDGTVALPVVHSMEELEKTTKGSRAHA